MPRATLVNGMTIAFEAISPTTGLAVSGVKVSKVAIYASSDDTADVEASTVVVQLPDVSPLWAPTPVDAS